MFLRDTIFKTLTYFEGAFDRMRRIVPVDEERQIAS